VSDRKMRPKKRREKMKKINDEPTFLEDGYQLVPRTRKRASLNGCLGDNVELFPKKIFYFFFTVIGGPLWVGSTKNPKKDNKSSVRPEPLFCSRVPCL